MKGVKAQGHVQGEKCLMARGDQGQVATYICIRKKGVEMWPGR